MESPREFFEPYRTECAAHFRSDGIVALSATKDVVLRTLVTDGQSPG
jgi:hypothetical protein